MWRAIGAVIVGYLTIFVFTFITFSAAYLGMGTERAFQPGSYEVTGLWLAVSFVLGFAGAVAGGWVCAAIARNTTPVMVLAGLVLALGILVAMAVASSGAPTGPTTRSSEVGNLEAMRHARQPLWVALINPVVGVAGVMLGAQMKKPKPPVA